jgi:hypothetical protein
MMIYDSDNDNGVASFRGFRIKLLQVTPAVKGSQSMERFLPARFLLFLGASSW